MTGTEIKHHAQLIIEFADSMKSKASIEQIKIRKERLNELKYLLKRPGLNLFHVMEQMPKYFPETRIYVDIIELALISFCGPYLLLRRLEERNIEIAY
jgi:hypothetical protein